MVASQINLMVDVVDEVVVVQASEKFESVEGVLFSVRMVSRIGSFVRCVLVFLLQIPFDQFHDGLQKCGSVFDILEQSNLLVVSCHLLDLDHDWSFERRIRDVGCVSMWCDGPVLVEDGFYLVVV